MNKLKCKCGTEIAEIGAAGQRYIEDNYRKCPKCGEELCVECMQGHECEKGIEKAIENAAKVCAEEFNCSYDYVLLALKEKQERDKGCEYCERENKCLKWFDLQPSIGSCEGDYGEFAIGTKDKNIYFHFLDKHTDENFKTTIYFCPICGRKLSEDKP
jgi:hypothetical protein